ncbi:MAG: lactonase family protein [Candidatus Anammoximicrobium sp.]|nr:lactonase family protein [Candidatus Anammoximicrobium sp.]
MKRLPQGTLSVLCLSLVAALAAAADQEQAGSDCLRIYVGTYTSGASQGIYLGRLDLADGGLRLDGVAAETKNPSFLALHPNRRFLYAVGEISDFAGKRTGAVNAFRIEPATGRLEPLNQQSSGGPGPCHVAVDHSGRNVLVANYGGGSAAVLPIRKNGTLGSATAFVQHQGASVNPRRQQGPHAHSINLDPANRFAFVADLGLDKVLIYRFDAAAGKLTPNDPPWASVVPGAGPRHFAFHPTGKFAYVINELGSSLTAFRYDAARGALEEVQTVSSLPAGPVEGNSTAEVQVHPSGKFLYGSNRGHDSIAVFAADAVTGQLKLVEHESTQGKTPRNFGVDPTGRFLLACNQASDTIVGFRIDQETGALTPTGQKLDVPSPVCVKFIALNP